MQLKDGAQSTCEIKDLFMNPKPTDWDPLFNVCVLFRPFHFTMSYVYFFQFSNTVGHLYPWVLPPWIQSPAGGKPYSQIPNGGLPNCGSKTAFVPLLVESMDAKDQQLVKFWGSQKLLMGFQMYRGWCLLPPLVQGSTVSHFSSAF